MKIKAIDVRKGHLLKNNEAILKVTDISHITPGRRAAIIHLETYDIKKNNKYDLRVSPEDDLEQVIVFNIPHIYSYENIDSYVFMNLETYEEIIISKDDIDGEKSKFLSPNQEVQLGIGEDGSFVTIQWPIKVSMLVKSAPPSQKNASSDDRKRVILSNDVGIVVPSYVKEGDNIIINLETMEFVSRN